MSKFNGYFYRFTDNHHLQIITNVQSMIQVYIFYLFTPAANSSHIFSLGTGAMISIFSPVMG